MIHRIFSDRQLVIAEEKAGGAVRGGDLQAGLTRGGVTLQSAVALVISIGAVNMGRLLRD